MLTFCGLTTDGMYEYLAAIYKLSDGDNKVTTSALAETMHVTPAAASSMLKRLEESGFVQRSSATGRGSECEQGRLAALQLVRRQRLLEVFLVQVMGFTWDQVAAEAHRMEHSISIAFEDRMDELCNFPTHCPHGDPIPRKDGTLPDEDLLPVVQLEPGQQASCDVWEQTMQVCCAILTSSTWFLGPRLS
jgi:DtxR family Mn-dependent transcriptional regulator